MGCGSSTSTVEGEMNGRRQSADSEPQRQFFQSFPRDNSSKPLPSPRPQASVPKVLYCSTERPSPKMQDGSSNCVISSILSPQPQRPQVSKLGKPKLVSLSVETMRGSSLVASLLHPTQGRHKGRQIEKALWNRVSTGKDYCFARTLSS